MTKNELQEVNSLELHEWFLSVITFVYICYSSFYFTLHLLIKILAPRPNDHIQPCNPSPCGSNSVCKERNGAASCTCIDEYFGDPYLGCRPECVTNSDCPSTKACFNSKCRDPCPGECGINAQCTVLYHNPNCACFEGYTGNPRANCYETPKEMDCKKLLKSLRI